VTAEAIVVSLLGVVAELAPGLLAALAGKDDDRAAIAHARELCDRMTPVVPRMQAASAARLAELEAAEAARDGRAADDTRPIGPVERNPK
jgi:hypothetical protein